MSKYVIDDTTLIGIGDAIRTKKGTSAQIPVPDLASEILSIPSGGGMPSWIVSGEMTPQENIESFTVTHNKGKLPSFALIYIEDMLTTARYIQKASMGIIGNGESAQFRSAMSYNNYQGETQSIVGTYAGISEMTDTVVTFLSRGGNYVFMSGYTYKYFLFFEEN